MRLAELRPKWVTLNGWKMAEQFSVGVSFDCPHCNEKRLAVMFWPPIDPAGLLGRMFELPDNGGHKRVSGDTFDTLTLQPSIGFDNPPHFHGHITNGEVTIS